MKRELLCSGCAKDNRKLFGFRQGVAFARPYAGEGVIHIPGKAKGPFICDMCGKDIMPLEGCVAQTIFTDTRPYSRWEEACITPEAGYENIP